MKKLLFLIGYFVLSMSLFAKNDIDSLLKVLDNSVDNYKVFSNQKEQQLNKLKDLLLYTKHDIQKYPIYGKLFDEYRIFNSDSALVYARKKIEIAERLKNHEYLTDARLNLADIMGIMGMYKEAMDVLQEVDISRYSYLKTYYFHIYRLVLGYMADFTASTQVKNQYEKIIDSYRDSILIYNKQNTNVYTIVETDQLITKKKYDEALKILLNYYPQLSNNEIHEIHDKAIVAFSISLAYNGKQQKELEKKWLIISAINDIRSATKEYISLRKLAFLIYEDGDIDRAYKYMKRSLDDALFCNARLRTYEVSKMIPIIDKAYKYQTDLRQRLMVITIVSISILTILLMLAVFIVYRQMKKMVIARKKLCVANEELITLNQELSSTNNQLTHTNEKLQESNLIKEVYIGRYIDQCSMYINKLDEYRRHLNKMIIEGKNENLINEIKSTHIIDEELKEFYSNFDSTFIQLFPYFIEELRELMIDDEEIKLKPGEILNTGLRVFALIRLGIKDSDKISFFLRYSITTIYNCRTRFRNKSKGPRNEFEAKVMQIGVFKY
ncbi:MAG: DUF6377 domain-containing protein [Paludibacter sp.]|nr:DUF6377 domain-containing protein [Paludibacter sp.]